MLTSYRWKAAAHDHPAYLGEFVFGHKPMPFHLEWHDHCSGSDHLVLFAPTEHGKSTQLSVIRPLWELGRNPDLRIAIFSMTMAQSMKWLSIIKTNIEHNPRLHFLFPGLRPEDRKGYPRAWYADAIIVKRSEEAVFEQKDHSVQALGIMGRILGARLDIAILDDVLGFENTITAAARQKVIDWFQSTLVGRMVPGGRIWIIGTAWHESDLAHYLEEEFGHVYKIVKYEAAVPPCVWPKQWPTTRLASRRQELGELEYSRQMRNIAFGAATNFISLVAARKCQTMCDDPREWWEGAYPDDTFRWIAAGVDLGMSRKEGAAETAIFVLGLDDRLIKHVLHISTGLWMGGDLLRQLVQIMVRFRVRDFLFETNAAQVHLAEMMNDRMITGAVAQQLNIDPAAIRRMRVFGQFTTEQNRNHLKWGIQSLAPEFEAEKWRIPQGRPQVDKWFRQLRDWTPWDHPGDSVVASWLASLRLRGRGVELPLKAQSR